MTETEGSDGEVLQRPRSADPAAAPFDFRPRLIYRCVVGSRAYGLEEDSSDTDTRGIYVPTGEQHWSLGGVPTQVEIDATQEHYWELQRFMELALKSNPNVLECLFTPLVQAATPFAEELLKHRSIFLSRRAYDAYEGYVQSQFKKIRSLQRNQGRTKWKPVMHLIRLLLSGIGVLRDGIVQVDMHKHRDRLLAIKHGQMEWESIERWRESLHRELEEAYAATRLPELPRIDIANRLLIEARRRAADGGLP